MKHNLLYKCYFYKLNHKSADSKVPNFSANFSVLKVFEKQFSISPSSLPVPSQIRPLHPLC